LEARKARKVFIDTQEMSEDEQSLDLNSGTEDEVIEGEKPPQRFQVMKRRLSSAEAKLPQETGNRVADIAQQRFLERVGSVQITTAPDSRKATEADEKLRRDAERRITRGKDLLTVLVE